MAINISAFKNQSSYSTYSKRMIENLVRMIIEDNRGLIKENNIDPIEYHTNSSKKILIRICPEPINFLKEITKIDSSTGKQEKFKKILESFNDIEVEKPTNDMWFNKTSNGINIRLGNLDGDRGNQRPAILGDNCVHGVVVGRTGSGKSVLINNIILNLITEYSPWELDLYLVDMKKVELSRYMANNEEGGYLTSHVSACGATSEVRYVVSMIQYLSDCMKARQSLFAALGIQKIKDFREKYSKELGREVVLPRILLLVDEFQQMFLEASGKERRILDECITAITKLGRATGVHLLFASQEMSGALGGKELANFKLRIALPCDASISSQILGNSAASNVIEKGITLVNEKGGSGEEDNLMYKTPFVDDSEGENGEASEFKSHLIMVSEESTKSKFRKTQKFYQEDAQEKIERIEEIRNNDGIKKQIQELKKKNISIIDGFLLGTGVLYNNKKNDYESFFLEKGKKRNIGILCVKDLDIANVLKTLSLNFRTSELIYEHKIIYESEPLRSVYPNLLNDLNTSENVEEINFSQVDHYMSAEYLFDIMRMMDFNRKPKEIFIDFFMQSIKGLEKKDSNYYSISGEVGELFKKVKNLKEVEKILEKIEIDDEKDILDEYSTKLILLTKENMEEQGKIQKSTRDAESNKLDEKEEKNKEKLEMESNIIQLLSKVMLLHHPKKVSTTPLLKKIGRILISSIKEKEYQKINRVFWIIGTDNLDKDANKRLSPIMTNCTNKDTLFILAGANPETLEDCYKCCNYIFLNSPDERIYNKYRMSFTKKSDDSKAIDFKIVNYNQERCYKQFYSENTDYDAPKLDFEEIEV